MLLIAVIHSYNLLGTLFSFNHKKPKGVMSVILYFAIMTYVFFLYPYGKRVFVLILIFFYKWIKQFENH